MLKSNFNLGVLNAQLETHTDGLYVSIYLDNNNTVTNICKLSFDDLVWDCLKTPEEDITFDDNCSELYVEIINTLAWIDEIQGQPDDFNDSGFTDDFSTTH